MIDETIEFVQSAPTGVRLLGIFIALINSSVIVLASLQGFAGYWLLINIAIAPFGIALFLSRIVLRISNDAIEMSFAPFLTKRISLEEISSVIYVGQIKPHHVGGIGYRVNPGGTTFIWRAGAAIEVRTEDARIYRMVMSEASSAHEIVCSRMASSGKM